MNNLSWFLYFADVLPYLSRAIGIISLLSIWVIGMVIVYVIVEDKYPRIFGQKVVIFITILVVFFGISSLFIPSKQTIYLIAASEIGETVVKTPEAQEMLDDVHKIIKLQLKELTKE
jgi:Na+/melibiose symporter-like transporter